MLKKQSRLFRAYLRKVALGKSGKGVLAETPQGLFIVDPSDFSVSRELLNCGTYDSGEIRVFQSILNPRSTLIIVGCHIGSVLVPLSKKAGRVIGFEPDPINFHFLELNLLLNRCSNVEIHQKAVGEGPKKVFVDHNPLNTGNTQIQTVQTGNQSPVEMISLDSFPDLNSADLVIMDIEGYEPPAIRGGRKLLSNTSFFFVEYCPKQLLEMGETAESFVDVIGSLYSDMYTIRHGVELYENYSWTDFLLKQRDRPGLLLNLLFTNQRLPGPKSSVNPGKD